MSEVCCLELITLRARPNGIWKGNPPLHPTWLFRMFHVWQCLDVAHSNSDGGRFALSRATVQLNWTSAGDRVVYFQPVLLHTLWNTHRVCPALGRLHTPATRRARGQGVPRGSPSPGAKAAGRVHSHWGTRTWRGLHRPQRLRLSPGVGTWAKMGRGFGPEIPLWLCLLFLITPQRTVNFPPPARCAVA